MREGGLLGDVMFEVVSFSITDGRGVTVNQVCVPHACADPGEMWESEIPRARAKKLTPGPGASGQGLGYMHLANGTTVQFPWTQTGIEIEKYTGQEVNRWRLRSSVTSRPSTSRGIEEF